MEPALVRLVLLGGVAPSAGCPGDGVGPLGSEGVRRLLEGVCGGRFAVVAPAGGGLPVAGGAGGGQLQAGSAW